jgi:Tfp pilus assembly protein PilF
VRFLFSLAPVLALAALVFGCAGAPRPEPGPPPPSPLPSSSPGHVETPAIASLMNSARADNAAGRLANAAASLERALRIEPRNPRLWQELSRVRLSQRDYVQAESCAARSNSWAGSDDGALRADNWRLIAQAREARGDADGAKAALQAVERLR